MCAGKKKRIIVVAILALMTAFVGFRTYLHINSNQKEAIKEATLWNGPWAKETIWEAANGQAYLLSHKSCDEKIGTVTAYFYINEIWHEYRVNMTYGNSLIFTDRTGAEKLSGDFDFDNSTFTVKNLDSLDGNVGILQDDSYVFSEVGTYDDLTSTPPFVH